MDIVGILVGQKVYSRIPSGRTGYEKLYFYEEAGEFYNLRPCYFRLKDIDFERLTVNAYIKKEVGKGYVKQRLPIPKVIHNRAIFRSSRTLQKLFRLTYKGIHIYNLCNRYNKLLIQEVLMAEPELRSHLPGTVLATQRSIQDFMRQYDSLILKPNNGSIGKGVYKLVKSTSGSWTIITPGGKRKRPSRITFRKRMPKWLRRKIVLRSYVLQQCLPLATYQGRPFDLRVSVQKNIEGDWQITGIVGKVARKNRFLTNVAQGGRVCPLPLLIAEYPDLDPEFVQTQVAEFAIRVVNQLSTQLPYLADLGLDIGITKQGYPVFIESNGRDQRYSFREGEMVDEWKATYRNPLGYARYLIDQDSG